ncbi:MAG: hypothetical protein K0Q94_7 [Paenibacillus sp.]|nr:hypothetical protein [Paenibacillus sp.]
MGNLQPATYPPIALSVKPGPTRTFPIKAIMVYVDNYHIPDNCNRLLTIIKAR